MSVKFTYILIANFYLIELFTRTLKQHMFLNVEGFIELFVLIRYTTSTSFAFTL